MDERPLILDLFCGAGGAGMGYHRAGFRVVGIDINPQGHEKVGRNLLIDEGKRKCRTCVYARNRERRRTHPMTAEQKARKLELQRQRRAREKQEAR